MKNSSCIIGFLFCLFLIGCSDDPTVTPETMASEVKMPPPTSERKQYLLDSAAAYYTNWINKAGFSGQYLIAKNGYIIYSRAAGFAKRETNEEMTLETPMHVASISKVATALAVLRLVDQGKIALNQKVTHYLPKFPFKEITVKMLLTHRSSVLYQLDQ